jgi:hypothetical protein
LAPCYQAAFIIDESNANLGRRFSAVVSILHSKAERDGETWEKRGGIARGHDGRVAERGGVKDADFDQSSIRQEGREV